LKIFEILDLHKNFSTLEKLLFFFWSFVGYS
jgi:hypothetical protein